MTSSRTESTRRVVWLVDYASLGESRTRRSMLATFWMVGDVLNVEYHDERWRQEVEACGIAVAAGCFYPRDGRAFFDNLSLAYSQSTLVRVDEDTAPALKVPRGVGTPGFDLGTHAGAAGRASPTAGKHTPRPR